TPCSHRRAVHPRLQGQSTLRGASRHHAGQSDLEQRDRTVGGGGVRRAPLTEARTRSPLAIQRPSSSFERRRETCQFLAFSFQFSVFSSRFRLPDYFLSATMAACAHWPSWALVPPETPIAPAIFPSISIGRPPSTGTAPSSPSTRNPSPPAASMP